MFITQRDISISYNLNKIYKRNMFSISRRMTGYVSWGHEE